LYRANPPSIKAAYRSLRGKLIYRSSPDFLAEFKGKASAFRDITDCAFDRDEIILAVGMSMSGQLPLLDSHQNLKIQYIHGATPWEPELMKKVLPLPYPKIAVASYLKPLIESFAGGAVLAVIPNGIDPRAYFCSAVDSEKTGIGTIYSSHPAKDPVTILGFVEMIHRTRPDIPVRMFGTERRPKSIGANFYWRFPSVESARGLYSVSRTWVLASRSEGFPAPILEAMACGAIPVATRCGGSTDIIEDGVNGYLVDVGDVSKIVSRVMSVFEDEHLASRMRSAAKETIATFSWDRCINQLESVLKGLL
jgi:glycosyltransferase involved in cell wall biosynthesis